MLTTDHTNPNLPVQDPPPRPYDPPPEPDGPEPLPDEDGEPVPAPFNPQGTSSYLLSTIRKGHQPFPS